MIDSGTSQKVTVSASLSRFLSSSPILFPDYLTRLPSLFSFSPLLPHISLLLPSFYTPLFTCSSIRCRILILFPTKFLPVLSTLQDFSLLLILSCSVPWFLFTRTSIIGLLDFLSTLIRNQLFDILCGSCTAASSHNARHSPHESHQGRQQCPESHRTGLRSLSQQEDSL